MGYMGLKLATAPATKENYPSSKPALYTCIAAKKPTPGYSNMPGTNFGALPQAFGQALVGYTYNSQQLNGGAWTLQRIGMFKQPSKTFALGDGNTNSTDASKLENITRGSECTIAWRHMNRANFSWLDGHVSFESFIKKRTM